MLTQSVEMPLICCDNTEIIPFLLRKRITNESQELRRTSYSPILFQPYRFQ